MQSGKELWLKEDLFFEKQICVYLQPTAEDTHSWIQKSGRFVTGLQQDCSLTIPMQFNLTELEHFISGM